MKQSVNAALKLARDIRSELDNVLKPPSETAPSRSEPVIIFSLVRGTRGYIEKLAHQINGTYSSGWYDACLVITRRLVETLIIESFEAHKLEAKIKDPGTGNFLYLGDLIATTLSESSWTLGRNTRAALPRLKDLGDKSAHSRRFVAHRPDVDRLIDDLRLVVQELTFLAQLK